MMPCVFDCCVAPCPPGSGLRRPSLWLTPSQVPGSGGWRRRGVWTYEARAPVTGMDSSSAPAPRRSSSPASAGMALAVAPSRAPTSRPQWSNSPQEGGRPGGARPGLPSPPHPLRSGHEPICCTANTNGTCSMPGQPSPPRQRAGPAEPKGSAGTTCDVSRARHDGNATPVAVQVSAKVRPPCNDRRGRSAHRGPTDIQRRGHDGHRRPGGTEPAMRGGRTAGADGGDDGATARGTRSRHLTRDDVSHSS